MLRALLTLLCAALALVVAGNSALAIALPDIGRELRADQVDLTWIIDAYALTFAALLLPAGIAADRLGRRPMLLAGLAVFGASVLASAYAADATQLILLRALAGAGAAAVFPVTLSALVDAYPPQRRGFAVAVWSGVSAAGAVAGTLLAGAVLEVAWWGGVQVAFGGAALSLIPGAARLVASHRDRSLAPDPVGAVSSALALAGLVFAVIEAPRYGWTDQRVVLGAGVGLLALAAFVGHERRTPAPSLDVRLFRDRGLSAGALLVTVQFFASLGLFVLAPQYLQLVRGYTPLQAAAALLVIPAGVAAGTALGAAALDRAGPRGPATAGLAAMAAGFAVLAATAAGGRLPWLAAGLLVFGVGFGLAVTPGTLLIIDGLPARRRSVASAVNDVTREVGGVAGIAVLSGVLLTGYRGDVAGALAGVPDALAAPARDGAAAALAVAGDLGPAGAGVAAAARASFAVGLSHALWWGAAVLALAAAVCAVLAPRGPRTAGSAPAATDAGSHR